MYYSLLHGKYTDASGDGGACCFGGTKAFIVSPPKNVWSGTLRSNSERVREREYGAHSRWSAVRTCYTRSTGARGAHRTMADRLCLVRTCHRGARCCGKQLRRARIIATAALHRLNCFIFILFFLLLLFFFCAGPRFYCACDDDAGTPKMTVVEY